MAASTSVDSSLWWDPFSLLLTELDNASLSSAELPPKLVKIFPYVYLKRKWLSAHVTVAVSFQVKKLDDNYAWFVDTVSLFKKPNEKSRVALDSQEVKIGSHSLSIQSEVRAKALKLSSYLVCLRNLYAVVFIFKILIFVHCIVHVTALYLSS